MAGPQRGRRGRGHALGRAAPGRDVRSCGHPRAHSSGADGCSPLRQQRAPTGTPPQAFCLQVKGPHSSCFSSKPHVHLGSRGLWTPYGHSPCPGKRGPPCKRDPPGQGHPRWDSGPSLTGSPGSAAPQSCAPPGAGCGCYGGACVGGEARQGPDPGPRGGGPGTDALKQEQPRLQGWSDRGLHCVRFLSKEKGRGTASGGWWVVSLGETPTVKSKLKVNDSVFSQFLVERAQGLTQKRAPPQPNIVTRAQRGKDRQKFRAETGAAATRRGPQQRPSGEEKVLRCLWGAPELERGAVSFRGMGGREGDEGSSGAEPRGTSVGRERISPKA